MTQAPGASAPKPRSAFDGRLESAFDVAFAITLGSLCASFVVLLPLALTVLIAAMAWAARRAPPAWSPLAIATLLVLAVWSTNVIGLVPAERLLTQDYWRWHGRAFLALAAFAGLLIVPLRPSLRSAGRGMLGFSVGLALAAVWGFTAMRTELPTEIDLLGPRLSAIASIHGGGFFHGFLRHHEVAGGVFAVGACYAIARWLWADPRARRARRVLDFVLMFAILLGLWLTMARAYWVGITCGVALLVSLQLVARPALARRRLLACAAAIAVSLLMMPEIGDRLGLTGSRRILSLTRTGQAALEAARESSLRRVPTPTHKQEEKEVNRIYRRYKDFYPSYSVWDRVIFWRAGLDMARQRPLFGFGIGMFAANFRDYSVLFDRDSAGRQFHLHNNAMQLLVDTGLIGLLLVLGWAGLLCAALLRVVRSPLEAPTRRSIAAGSLASAVVLAVGGLLDTSIYAPTLMLPLLLPAAALLNPGPTRSTMTRPAAEPAERANGVGEAEILVSSTVKDLAVGAGLRFGDRGEHKLKGVEDPWRLFRVLD